MDTGNKKHQLNPDKGAAEASEGSTMCSWRTGKLRSGWEKKRWTFYRLLCLEENAVVHKCFSRLPGLQAVWPTTLCCTFTSVSVTSVCVKTTGPGAAAQLLIFVTFHYCHLYTAWNTVSLTIALIFGFLTEICHVVQWSSVSFLKNCCLKTLPHFLLVMTVTYLTDLQQQHVKFCPCSNCKID